MAAGGTTIIKRKKVSGGDGHHGGAWKVAYADFVTAMMAFFLLMWLLNATSEEQKQGLAEYFDPKVPIARLSGGGTGAFGGDSMMSEDTMAQNGTGASKNTPSDNDKAKGETGASPDAADREGVAEAMTALDNMFRGMSGESEQANALLQHIRTRVTDEGLVIELFDTAERPLYEKGTARPTAQMRALLKMVGQVTELVTNKVAIDGHTDDRTFPGGDYTNWELSSDRALSARRALVTAGLAEDRVARVVGKADRDPSDVEHPSGPRNRRVEIILLRSDL
ncbi:chemotaxis protein MotB [Albimonas donghaensis]|uniref:Chemotaxis protein MotB n=1 Tax=Albimonas donghaensis TaxID=356660 RepID=A0A1H2X9U0_9RHOB|nr:flagellar motor protein MotB [Albimonas donghaensis]SDW89620.1 chemotaxis protein MotB [Albimonas donghaensis]